MTFTIRSECANSGRQIEIALDSELNIANVTDGSEPMFCLPLVSLAKTNLGKMNITIKLMLPF